MDSTVAADVAVRWGDADLLVYLDTGTGLSKNLRYVQRLSDWMGVQLWTLRTHESYIEKVRDIGFPGAGLHGIMYRNLKERQISKLAGRVDDLHCWTGARRQESDNRMAVVDAHETAAGGRWTWHSPILDWSKQDCRDYIKRYEIPCSPLWEDLQRSGDCYCGCYGSPEEKLSTLAAGCDGRVAWLEALEQQSTQGDEKDVWAHSALSDPAVRAERVKDSDDQMTLCSHCGLE
jgi:3'-phosphoadenosine 5'-phosphosulfate sulfotransferase (PAPS reductase)/FAD synthetase